MAKKKWTPTKKQLEEYNKKKEQVMEMSKNCINDIFKNYDTDQDKIIEYLEFASKFYNYSPKNVAMIKNQLPKSIFVQSSAAWVKMGAFPKKGTHGAKILVPSTKKLIVADKKIILECTDLSDKIIKKLKESPSKDAYLTYSEASKQVKELLSTGKAKTIDKVVFGFGTVFDIAQTTFPKEDYPKLFTVGIEDSKSNYMYNAICSYINEKTPYQITEEEFESITLHGFYLPLTNCIMINNILEDSEKTYVMLHELGHAFYHNREETSEYNKTNNLHIVDTERMEIQADVFAVMSLSMYNFDINDSLKDHLKNNYNLLKKKLCNIDKSEEEILKYIEEISTDAMKKFNQHAKEMNQYIEEYTIKQEQTQTQVNEEIIEEYDEENDILDMSF